MKNNTSFDWISFEKNQNVVKNFRDGINRYKKKYILPSQVIKIDADTEWMSYTLDVMFNTLFTQKLHSKKGYCYCSFEFRGSVNMKFPAIPFDPMRLTKGNYISSNTMFLTKIIEEIPLVTKDKYIRLLDWAYLLRLLNNNVVGVPAPSGHFIAHTSQDAVSARSKEDYMKKHQLVVNDFVKPYLDKKSIFQNLEIPQPIKI